MTRPIYRVIVVCTGNICRSPMGEFILRERFEAARIGGRVAIESAGTHSWEVGSPADPRTLTVLARHGHPDFGRADHVARTFRREWMDEVDLILAADSGHRRHLLKLARTDEQRAKVQMFRSFDPEAVRAGQLDMVDPWYGDDEAFDRTYAEVMAAADGVVEHVWRELARSAQARTLPPGGKTSGYSSSE